MEARPGAAPGLVVDSDVAKEIRHGLAVVDSSDGFRENQTDIHSLYLRALQLLDLVRNCVGYYHLWSIRKKSISRAADTLALPELPRWWVLLLLCRSGESSLCV